MPKQSEFEVVFTDGWTEEDHKAYDEDWTRRHLDRTFFLRALAPSPFHWHFQQASEALENGLFLPGLSGLLNGIEASLRTICCRAKELSLDGDLGRVMSNPLLKEAEQVGLRIETLAFPEEMDFLEKVNNRKDPVQLVALRNDICHGNFQSFVRKVPEVDELFTPECLGPVSARMLDISHKWALELSRYMGQKGWKTTDAGLQKPENPLNQWLS